MSACNHQTRLASTRCWIVTYADGARPDFSLPSGEALSSFLAAVFRFLGDLTSCSESSSKVSLSSLKALLTMLTTAIGRLERYRGARGAGELDTIVRARRYWLRKSGRGGVRSERGGNLNLDLISVRLSQSLGLRRDRQCGKKVPASVVQTLTSTLRVVTETLPALAFRTSLSARLFPQLAAGRRRGQG